nr:signal peptidase I [bacterium]
MPEETPKQAFPLYPAGGQKKRRRLKGSVREFIITILTALVLVVVVRVFVFELAIVDGPSMQPTLNTNNRVFVFKAVKWFRDMPERGEVIVTKYPDRSGSFIKRVVAVAGDRVRIENGITYVNDVANTMGNGETPIDMQEIVIPEGHYFVMGDNRCLSLDSHNAEVGPLPVSYFIGRAEAVVWPISQWKCLDHATGEGA